MQLKVLIPENKVLFLTIVGIIAFGIFPMRLFGEIGKEMPVILLMVLWLIGYSRYRYNINKTVLISEKIIIIIFLLIFITSAYAVPTYHQSFLSTLSAQRYNLTFLYLVLFAKMNLTPTIFEKTFKNLTVFSIFSLILAIYIPNLYANEEYIEYLKNQQLLGQTSDFSVRHPGVQAVLLYLFFYSRKVLKNPSLNTFKIFFLLFIYLILCQNRSTLLAAIPLMIYVGIKGKYKYKSIILPIAVIIVIVIGSTIFINLFEETQSQLENPAYNRLQAISFFILEPTYNWFTIIFGHSVPCAGSKYLASLLFAQEYRLAFITDIGLLGTFYYYGIAMVIVILYFILKGCISPKTPIWLKIYSAWWLFVPWIQCFALSIDNIRACIFIYLIIFYTKINDKRFSTTVISNNY